MTLLRGLSGKESACNAEDLGSVPELGRSPGERNGHLLKYSCLENSMDRGVLWATLWGHQELDMTEQIGTQAQQGGKTNSV